MKKNQPSKDLSMIFCRYHSSNYKFVKDMLMKLVFRLRKVFNIKFHRRFNESILTHVSYYTFPFFLILQCLTIANAVFNSYHEFKRNFYNLKIWGNKIQKKSSGKVKHELPVKIYELQVQIYELRVQIRDLRVQIHKLGD